MSRPTLLSLPLSNSFLAAKRQLVRSRAKIANVPVVDLRSATSAYTLWTLTAVYRR
jgi:hypothetical protein